MTVKVTLGPNLGYNGGAYPLLVDGKEVGRVQKYEKRYNLRRMIVDKGWVIVTDRDSVIAPLHGGEFDTRKAAVAHVDAHLRDSALRRGVCPDCEHQRHDERCAVPESIGVHWVRCGCEGAG